MKLKNKIQWWWKTDEESSPTPNSSIEEAWEKLLNGRKTPPPGAVVWCLPIGSEEVTGNTIDVAYEFPYQVPRR
jgi:hypothetical protein